MSNETKKWCYVCSVSSDTRPYGEGGRDICFDCANATPERKAIATEQMTAHLKTLRSGVLVFHNDKPPTDDPADKGVAVIISRTGDAVRRD